ncbi:MAG: CapA family protein [Candidatus Cloacimonetes bacterium]|nr:CapA family protein [Candidatus Cloacimonadota bacterium]
MAKQKLRITFLGDVVAGGILSFDLGVKAISQDISDTLHQSNLVVANLESPFGIPEWQVSLDKPIIYSRPQDAVRLREMNISAVSLANNHISDLGEEGFQNTLDILDEMGIAYFGAGHNSQQARAPLYLTKNGIKLGFLAYCGAMNGVRYATADSSGVALLDEKTILSDVSAARQHCDYLYVLLHWNWEYTWLPCPESPSLLRKILDAGAAGMIGGHSHRLQSYGSYKGKPYFYSLGNFLFPDYIIGPPRTVYYPADQEKLNTKDLPVMSTNKPADKLYYRSWRKYSRIGLIGEVEIKGGRQISTAKFSWSDANSSRLSFLPVLYSAGLHVFLKILGWLINGPWYPAVLNGMMRVSQLLKKVVRYE